MAPVLGGRERAVFPADVELTGDGVRDAALEETYTVSPSARAHLALLAAGLSFPEGARALSNATGTALDLAERNLRSVAYTLNDAALLNIQALGVRGHFDQLFRFAWLALLTRRPPRRLNRRHPVRCDRVLAAHRDVALGIGRGFAPYWVLIGALCATVMLLAPAAATPLLLVPTLPAAVVCHEAAHAVAVGRSGGGCFLVTAGLSVALAHSPKHSSAAVHMAGPVVTGAWGCLLVTAAVLSGNPLPALAALPFAVQLLALTTLCTDGRLLIRAGESSGRKP